MPRKGHAPEQILNKLRQVEVAVSNGKQVAEAVREIGVSQHTYYRWRTEYGALLPVPDCDAGERDIIPPV